MKRLNLAVEYLEERIATWAVPSPWCGDHEEHEDNDCHEDHGEHEGHECFGSKGGSKGCGDD